MKKFVLILPLFLLLAGCDFWTNVETPEIVCDNDDCPAISVFAKTPIEELSINVLDLLNEWDMAKLSEFVDPEKWLHFSAYWDMTDDDVVLSKEAIKLFGDEVYVRWRYDWSWDPIELTMSQFFDEFITNLDYSQAPEVIYNNIVSRWNTIVNIVDYFPDAEYVEYYFPSLNPEYAWMDWESLVLIFDKDTHYLVWLSHEQWTI